jgi:1-acyl-sn-glycerol-3-phosphate acyltransferase
MRSKFWRFVLKLFGWKFVGGFRPEMAKCVMIEAPHTSVWDFIIGRIGVWILGLNGRFLIKKEFFVFPISGLLKRMGGLPVDRGNRNNNIVNQVAKHFAANDKFTIVITPEGTRRYTKNWKRGFYEIAMEAGVPIVLSFINYGNKTCGVMEAFYPTGNYADDIVKIQEKYKDVEARYPEQFNMSKMYWDKN